MQCQEITADIIRGIETILMSMAVAGIITNNRIAIILAVYTYLIVLLAQIAIKFFLYVKMSIIAWIGHQRAGPL